MNTAALLSVVLLWSIAVLCKLVSVHSSGTPYTFTMWDGGLMLRGRVLGRAGSIALAVFCIVMAGVSVHLLAQMGLVR
jgi:hypothetical protein